MQRRVRLIERFIMGAWLMLLLWVALGQPVQAAERAWITTEGVMAYSNGAWVAVGGVKLVQGDMEVTAQRMRYDVEAGRIDFVEHVVIRDEDGIVEATAFTYDVHTASGIVKDALAVFEVEEFDGPLYVIGDEINYLESGDVEVHNAKLTTCEPPRSAGYYLVSRRMDIFPGDRIVIRSVRFIESGMTLFYWPYLSIPLDPRRSGQINFPEVGHNPTDGWYVKTRHAYDGPGEGHGEVALDVMQYRGIGTGVHHVYRDRPDSEGSITAYTLKGFGDGPREWRLGWNESFPLNDNSHLTWKSVFLSTPVTRLGQIVNEREAHGSLTLTHTRGVSSSRIDWDRRQYWDRLPGRIDRLKLTHRSRPYNWQWRLQLDGMSRRREGYDDRDVLGYNTSLSRRLGAFTLRFDLEHRLHSGWLSGSSSQPLWKSRSRLPEASVTLDVGAFTSVRVPLDIEVAHARMSEVRRVLGTYQEFQSDRTTVDFRLRTTSVSLGRFGRIQSRGGVAWYAYSTGERRMVVSADHQYRLTLTPRLSLYGNYIYRQPLGDSSPFDFEATSSQERVTARLQYAYGLGNVILSTGYDLLRDRPNDVIGQITFRSGSKVFGSVQGGYSLTSSRITYASANVTLQPTEGFRLTTSTRFNAATQRLEGLSGSLTYAIPGWRFLYETALNSETGVWTRGDAAIVRDLGCREIGLRLDSLLGAVWLEYRINALPGEGIRLGASQDRFHFDPDSIMSLF